MQRFGKALMLVVLALAVVPTAALANVPAGRDSFGNIRSIEDHARALPGAAAALVSPSFVSQFDCMVDGGGAANVLLDCDSIFPNNEPHVAVDPTDPQHLVASSNDYDSCCDEFYTSFDGGRTWTTGNMSALEDATGSDPVTSFDAKHGTVIHASLNFGQTGESKDPDDGGDGDAAATDSRDVGNDVVASISTDGGVTWGEPVVAYH